jgi:capsular exopolysaccharide synthesis family protein
MSENDNVQNQIPDQEYVENELTLSDIFRIFKRRFWIFFLVVVVTVVITGIYLFFFTVPIYEASVTMKIDPTSQSSSLDDIFSSSLYGTSNADISTEIELIKSRGNFEKVVTELDLVEKIYTDEEIAEMEEEGLTRGDIEGNLVRKMSDMVTVSSVKDTRIVKISVRGSDRVLAKDVANKLAEVYNLQMAEFAKRELTIRVDFIKEQIPSLEEELNEATDKLREFKERTGIYVLEDQASWLLDMLSKYDTQYTDTQLLLEEEKAKLDIYRDLVENFEDDQGEGLNSKWIKTSQSLSMNPIISQLQSKITELKVELASLEEQYTQTDPRIKAIKAQIVESERLVEDEVEKYIVSGESLSLNPEYQTIVQGIISGETSSLVIESSLNAIDSMRNEYQAKLNELPTQEQELLELTRNINVLESLYTLLLTKNEEAKINEASIAGNSVIIDAAIVPISAVAPNKKLTLAIGGVLGIFLGILLIFILEYADKSIKSEKEVEHITGLNTIGRIPMLKDTEDEIVLRKNINSPEAEAIKITASNINYSLGDKKSVGITSSLKSEGKTVLTANIAFALSENNKKVLLVDLDFRRPRLERVFGLKKREKGILSVLVDNYPVEEAIYEIKKDLYILPCEKVPPNPTMLLSSKKLEDLLGDLESNFDQIVFDMPPALIVSDVLVASKAIDTFCLVVNPEKSTKDSLKLTVKNLRTGNVNLIGTILNGSSEKNSDYYYYYYYYYQEDSSGRKKRKKKRKK